MVTVSIAAENGVGRRCGVVHCALILQSQYGIPGFGKGICRGSVAGYPASYLRNSRFHTLIVGSVPFHPSS
ncbi:hypothetical protein KCP78_18220 [Salmonella enterica subsp. enterica]|nr:hypothetical protein KCP78_18220 [Salmonella enterica subsp. enterica]